MNAATFAERLVSAAPSIINNLDAMIEDMHRPTHHWWHYVLPGLWAYQTHRFEVWKDENRRDLAEAERLLANWDLGE